MRKRQRRFPPPAWSRRCLNFEKADSPRKWQKYAFQSWGSVAAKPEEVATVVWGIEPRSPVNANQCFVFQVESESRIVLMLPDSAQSLCGVERVPYFTAGRWQQQSAERGHHESSVGEHRRHDRRPSEKGNHCWPGQQRTRRKRLRFRSFAALQVLMLSCVVFIWPVALAGAKVAGVDWSMSPTPIFKQHQVGTGSVCT